MAINGMQQIDKHWIQSKKSAYIPTWIVKLCLSKQLMDADYLLISKRFNGHFRAEIITHFPYTKRNIS